MNASRFDAAVKKRAAQRVAQRIEKFREALSDAVYALTDGRVKPTQHYQYWESDAAKALFAGLSNANRWPAELWKNEEAKVEAELLATMDEMAKALLAPDVPADGPQPFDETPKP